MPTSAQESLLDHAQALARERGFKVLPLRPRGKPPAREGWQESASSDFDAISAAWERAAENCNVGVLCGAGALQDGSSLIVVDADLHKPGAREALADLDTQGVLPPTFTVRTARGGEHRYYRAPPGTRVASGVDCLGVGLDVKADGGQVVGPGSYVVDREKGYEGGYSVIDDAPIAPIAAALLARLSAPRERAENAAVPVVDWDKPENIAEAWRYLAEDAPPAIEGHGGDKTTYDVACRLRDLGLSELTALDLMAAVYNPRCGPPWDEDGLGRKVENAYRYAKGRPGADTPEALCAGLDISAFEAAKPEPPKPATPAAPQFPIFRDGDDWRTSVDWLFYDLLPARGTGFLTGAPGSGKTFVAIDLAVSIASGRPFFGATPDKQGGVLYLASEDASGLRKRLAAAPRGQSAPLPISIIDVGRIDGKERQRALAELLLKERETDAPALRRGSFASLRGHDERERLARRRERRGGRLARGRSTQSDFRPHRRLGDRRASPAEGRQGTSRQRRPGRKRRHDP